jgi:hypothetical protein
MDGTIALILIIVIITILVSRNFIEIEDYGLIPSLLFLTISTLWLLLRFIIKKCLFPGSFWLFKRIIESRCSMQISLQMHEKIKNLREYLDTINKHDIPLTQVPVENSKKILASLIKNYQTIKNPNKIQKKVLKVLLNIKSNLEHIIVLNGEEKINLWKSISSQIRFKDSISIYIETISNNFHMRSCIKNCKVLEKILYDCFTPKRFVKAAYRLMANQILGNHEYLKADLENRFKGEEVIIEIGRVNISW